MSRAKKRIFWAFVFVACTAALAMGRRLEPDPRGFGTHVALTRGPCLFRLVTGIPCATCGMTTSFAWATRLRIGKAFVAQPFGALLCVCAAVMVPVALFSAVTGHGLRVCIPPDWALGAALVFLIAGWAYKIMSCSCVL